MFKINLFIDNAWEFDKSVKLNPNFDVKTNIRSYDSSECYETSEQAYNAIAEKIERLLIRVGFDFSKIGALRVCVFDVNEKNIESVNFKLVDNGQVGVLLIGLSFQI